MKPFRKLFWPFVIVCCLSLAGLPQAMAAITSFDPDKMADMSDFDPSNPIIPTGDTIKVALVASFSGPAAIVGEIYFISAQWAAHDINKRGGILVDGKRKMVQIIRANHQSQPAQTKKIAERMVLQEKVDVLWGTNGSHLMKIINQVADKYKTIAQCTAALSDELYDAKNFTRYSFMSSFQTSQIGRAAAYYYSQRKKEKKFYILCQDYLFGHSIDKGFK
ncbi:MAG: ABC transporter substrate-binding protein [Deltaproteobacteria bacterium]|nr:MAG: ABC transporter substrate-binding protein [Deltaproteobacteria bacterium]